MHRGRSYPFYPDYWATEAWFWPGFVPWKIRASLPIAASPPWDPLGYPFDAVSDAGVVVSDRTQISYHWSLIPPATATDLEVSLEMITVSDVQYARWKAKLLSGMIEVADAWLYQDFPQRVVSTGGNLWNLVNSPVLIPPFLNLVCLPATYAEGGSPWD